MDGRTLLESPLSVKFPPSTPIITDERREDIGAREVATAGANQQNQEKQPRKTIKKRKMNKKTKTRRGKKKRKIVKKTERFTTAKKSKKPAIKKVTRRPITRFYTRFYISKTDSLDRIRGDKIGLPNIGNSCFLSAVLQCLRHTHPLISNLDVLTEYQEERSQFSDESSSSVGDNNDNAGKLIEAFVELMNNLRNDSEEGVSLSDLKENERRLLANIRVNAPQFSGFSQQDAQELLRYLLLGLHEDLNKVGRSSGFPNNGGIIFDLFCGQLKSTLECTVCRYRSETLECFWDLSVPIPKGRKKATLHECIESFLSLEVLDGDEKPMCQTCNKRTICTKKFEINRFPVILVIHIKRFSFSNLQRRYKLNAMVDYGHLMEMSSYAPTGGVATDTLYRLYGVVDHYGTLTTGHYTAKCKEHSSGLWHTFNDMQVKASSADDLVTKHAYLLFYEKERGLVSATDSEESTRSV